MRYRFTFLAFLCAVLSAQAQISEGGQPLAFQPDGQRILADKPLVPVVLPAPNWEKVRAEDERASDLSRFAVPIAADISPASAGEWTDLPGGDRLWRCAVKSPGALGLVLLFDDFHLPAGGRLFAYTPDRRRVRGAYTEASNVPSGKFTIGVLTGEVAVLEYREPAAQRGQARLHINRVDHAYQRALLAEADPAAALDFGQSEPCNVNVNCPAGTVWQTEKKGIARILMVLDLGSVWCTGSLIANTNGTAEPLMLTARHCELFGNYSLYDNWVFDFQYESADCNNPASEPVTKSVLGCERLAFRMQTDFLLLKLNPLPTSYGLYFNGWSRSSTPSANTTFIHHPQGDIKKISVDNQPPVIYASSINWGGQFGISTGNTHWKVVPDIGIFQGGSSGCPLFDAAHRIIGQLHGGVSNMNDACVVSATYFGRFDFSWAQGTSSADRLKDWLDPAGIDPISQNGYVQPIPPAFSISGNVLTHWGAAMPGVKMTLTGGASRTQLTNFAGYFHFDSLASNLAYSLTASYDTNALNGVTTFDMVLMSKHILALDTLDAPYQLIAADANSSGSITTYDIVEVRKLVLGLSQAFPNSAPSWRFVPTAFVFADPTQPYLNPIPTSIEIPNLQESITNAHFKGIKMGDTNNSAIPGE